MVTDFFGIFFTLTWVFYATDVIHGEYWGYFNIFGYIWIWKVVASIFFPVSLGLLAFFGYGFWYMLYEEWRDMGTGCECLGFSVAWVIFC